MPGNYSHITRTNGTILTASIYNQDHQNHINNMTPDGVDDHSQTLTTMRAATDPGETGSESFATSLGGEIERLRFAIQDIKTYLGLNGTYWYNSPSGVMAPSLVDDYSATVTQMRATTDPGSGGSESLATDLRGELERLRFAIKAVKDTFGNPVTYWYDPPVAISLVNAGTQVRNLSGSCSGSTVTISASEVVLRRASGESAWVTGVSGTCNIATAGPIINGRDQASAFADNSFVYIYWIWNGSTTATLASATGPVSGPTLPSGYTHYALATIVRNTTSSTLLASQIRGKYVGFSVTQLLLDTTTPTADTRTAVSCPNTDWIDSHLLELRAVLQMGGADGNCLGTFGIALTNGSSDRYVQASVAANRMGSGASLYSPTYDTIAGFLPAQNTYYYYSTRSTSAATLTTQLRWSGYTVQNGA